MEGCATVSGQTIPTEAAKVETTRLSLCDPPPASCVAGTHPSLECVIMLGGVPQGCGSSKYVGGESSSDCSSLPTGAAKVETRGPSLADPPPASCEACTHPSLEYVGMLGGASEGYGISSYAGSDSSDDSSTILYYRPFDGGRIATDPSPANQQLVYAILLQKFATAHEKPALTPMQQQWDRDYDTLVHPWLSTASVEVEPPRRLDIWLVRQRFKFNRFLGIVFRFFLELDMVESEQEDSRGSSCGHEESPCDGLVRSLSLCVDRALHRWDEQDTWRQGDMGYSCHVLDSSRILKLTAAMELYRQYRSYLSTRYELGARRGRGCCQST